MDRRRNLMTETISGGGQVSRNNVLLFKGDVIADGSTKQIKVKSLENLRGLNRVAFFMEVEKCDTAGSLEIFVGDLMIDYGGLGKSDIPIRCGEIRRFGNSSIGIFTKVHNNPFYNVTGLSTKLSNSTAMDYENIVINVFNGGNYKGKITLEVYGDYE